LKTNQAEFSRESYGSKKIDCFANGGCGVGGGCGDDAYDEC
jgi:hypothetical protein